MLDDTLDQLYKHTDLNLFVLRGVFSDLSSIFFLK